MNSIDILYDKIDYWVELISKDSGKNYRLYELAFFKIFVKFELFLRDIFQVYCTGETISKNYSPERKLEFENVTHLDGILKSQRTSYIDYLDKIENYSKFIFKNEKNPFSLIFENANYNTYYSHMKIIRNYIAHESNEARKKYHKNVIGEHKDFIEPYKFLKGKNKKLSIPQFSLYVRAVEEMTNILLDPAPYLK